MRYNNGRSRTSGIGIDEHGNFTATGQDRFSGDCNIP
jgi:hypothetical protein